MITQEFYDQRKWLDIHRQADSLIASKDGSVICAVYTSPLERTRQDREDFIWMLRQWADTLEGTPMEL